MNRVTTGLRKEPRQHAWLWDQIHFRRFRLCVLCGIDGTFDIREPEPEVPACTPHRRGRA